MTKRIFRSIFLVACAVFLSCLVIIMAVMFGYFSEVQESQLKAQATLAVQGVEQQGMDYFDGLKPNGYRLTWVAADGTVLYDTETDSATMENHGDRAEIQAALTQGVGESARYSATLSTKTLYRAEGLTDGTVLRVAAEQITLISLIISMLQPILIVLIVALALSALLANRLSKRVVEPLNRFDLDHPLENDAYPELSPFLTRIEHQHRQIEEQLDTVKRQQDEITSITESMNEGLILLNDQGVILSINKAALRLFDADKSCVGRDFLTVDRSSAIQTVVEEALKGHHGEITLNRLGQYYQLDATAILWQDKVSGVVLLSFDVTEKVQAEATRREFTANVSHELKSPLQSIMGSAELMENQLVKAEDMPRFIHHIRSESMRLVTLIDDTLRLSQLDEGVEMPKEETELLTLAEEVAETLAHQAASRGLQFQVSGEAATVFGVRRLYYEIIYNLCDNAVKYNKEKGKVTVTVQREATAAMVTVADTGIGIPKDQQNRVFERFFRVDKSHSRETGGTGLGLSIVKHAAQYLGAELSLVSEVGKGTTIKVRFPLQ